MGRAKQKLNSLANVASNYAHIFQISCRPILVQVAAMSRDKQITPSPESATVDDSR